VARIHPLRRGHGERIGPATGEPIDPRLSITLRDRWTEAGHAELAYPSSNCASSNRAVAASLTVEASTPSRPTEYAAHGEGVARRSNSPLDSPSTSSTAQSSPSRSSKIRVLRRNEQPQYATELTAVPTERPLLRGTLHGIAFVVAVAVGVLLIVYSPESRILPAAVFAASAAVMLGTSTLYHRITWSRSARLWMRRADHAGVFLLIAGTYTPVALISLNGAWKSTVLAIVWSGLAVLTVARRQSD
jgi:hypothetical protein